MHKESYSVTTWKIEEEILTCYLFFPSLKLC